LERRKRNLIHQNFTKRFGLTSPAPVKDSSTDRSCQNGDKKTGMRCHTPVLNYRTNYAIVTETMLLSEPEPREFLPAALSW
jgi:hypothetical protein